MRPAPSRDTFADHRARLFGVAYHILGSVADAEDAVQDAWLRWQTVDESTVEDPEKYLVRVTARLAVDQLRSARARRESYVGSWLPEPLVTEPDAADRAVLRECVSMAMLLVLETLTPLERVVFVLREVFGYSYGQIAEAVGGTEAATRQTAARARAHVDDRRARYDVDHVTQRSVVDRFLAACSGGDLVSLMSMLAPDVALTSDGGGLAQAPRKPILGAELVAWALVTFAGRPPENATTRVMDVNSAPGIVVYSGSRPAAALAAVFRDGVIVELYLVVNPQKLSGVPPLA